MSTVLKNEDKKNYRLSLEPAYQVIYWSVSSILFSISLIGILEIQRANAISIIFALLFVTSVYLGMGSHLIIQQNKIYLNYLRGIKKTDISIDEIGHATVYRWGQDLEMKNVEHSVVLYFFNKKNKQLFWKKFLEMYPEVSVTKDEDTVSYIHGATVENRMDTVKKATN